MKLKALFGVLAFIASLHSFGTHLRGGYIQVTGGEGRTVTLKIFVYTNTQNTTVLFGGDQDVLDFGDGQFMLVPEQPNQNPPTLPEHVGFAYFEVQHTYNSNGIFTISYREPNRNEGVINFDNSVTTTFYIETTITVDPLLENYATPTLFFEPEFKAFVDQPFSRSMAAFDPDGGKLEYSLVTPKSDRNQPVLNYRLPSTIQIDKLSGLLTWDGKFNGSAQVGEYLFNVKVDKYVEYEGEMIRVSSMSFDFQVILEDGQSTVGPPSGSVEGADIDIFENNSKTFKVFTPYDEADEIEVLVGTQLPEPNFTITSYDSTDSNGPLRVTSMTVTTDASIVRNYPYVVSVRSIQKTELRSTWDINYLIFTTTHEPDPVLSGEKILSRFISPNPVKDFVVMNDIPANSTAEIIGLNGVIVVATPINSGQTLDLSHLSQGIYLIRIRNNKNGVVALDRLVKN